MKNLETLTISEKEIEIRQGFGDNRGEINIPFGIRNNRIVVCIIFIHKRST